MGKTKRRWGIGIKDYCRNSTVGIVRGGYLSLKIEGKEEVRSNF